ncbi:MAG: hypothetical protein ACNA8W_26115, partial [Bradymonadaceae bacterium]
MIEEIAREAGKSLWKDVGEDALKKAVGTIVSEGIKAVIDVWKQRRLKVQEFEIKQSQKATEAEMKVEKAQEAE